MSHEFANLPLDDEQWAFVRLLDDFGTNELQPVHDDTDGVRRAAEQLAAHGLWAVGAPECIGGGNASTVTTMLASVRLAAFWPSLALANVHANACVVVLGQHEPWHALGNQVCAGAPAALIDCLTSQADLELHQEDDCRKLVGTVNRLDTVADASTLVLLDPVNGPGLSVALEPGAEGVHVGPARRTMGLSGVGTRQAQVDVVADRAMMPIEPDLTTAARSSFLLGCAAVACGIAEASLSHAIDYARVREQFDGRLIDLPIVRDMLADAALRHRRCLQSVFSLAAMPGMSPLAMPAVASCLRSTTSDALEIANAAVQVHGGYGYLTEYPAEQLLRDAMSLRAASCAFETSRYYAESR